MAPTTILPALPNSQPRCLLLSKLAAELRNKIYEFALSNAKYTGGTTCWPLYIEGGSLDLSYQTAKHPLALLLTCRQIYHEAAGFYFHIHHIGFLLPRECLAFQAEMGGRHVDAVKTLTVMCGDGKAGEEAIEAVNAVVGFPRLDVLTLRIQEEERLFADEMLQLVVEAVPELKQGVARLGRFLKEVRVDAEALGVVPGVNQLDRQVEAVERVTRALNEGITKK